MNYLVARVPRQEADRDDVPRVVHAPTAHTHVVPAEQAVMQGRELVVSTTKPTVMLIPRMDLIAHPLGYVERLTLGVSHSGCTWSRHIPS